MKGEPKVHYSTVKDKKKGYFDILKDIRKHVTLVQLMDYLGNLNRTISVFGYWIFEYNYKWSLVLNRESLDMICAPYVGEEQVTEFETVFTSVICICFAAQLNKF